MNRIKHKRNTQVEIDMDDVKKLYDIQVESVKGIELENKVIAFNAFFNE